MGKAIWIFLIIVGSAIAILAFKGNGWSNKDLFHSSRILIHKGEFKSGRKGLNDFLNISDSSDFNDRAHFLIAKSYLGEGNIVEAKAKFTDLIKSFPNSFEARKAEYKLVWIEYLENGKEKALGLSEKLMGKKDNPYKPELEFIKSHGE